MKTFVLLSLIALLCVLLLIRINRADHSYSCLHKSSPDATTDRFLTKLQTLSQETTIDGLLELGDCYMFGFYPFYRPNMTIAKQVYSTAAQIYHDPLALAKLHSDSPLRGDSKGQTIPSSYAHHAISYHTKQQQFINEQEQHVARQQLRYLQQQQQRLYRYQHTPVAADMQPVVAAAAPRRVRRLDTQNVHDSAMTGIIKTNIDKLQKNHITTAQTDIKSSLNQLASIEIDAVKMNQAIDSLNSKSKHSRFGITEAEALSAVYNDIQTISDPIVRNNALETLGKQLASTVEHGKNVCSQGKIVQIMETLDGINPNMEKGRDITTIQQELHTLAAKTRSDVLNTPVKLQKYNQGDTELEHEVQDQFNERANTIYVENLSIGKNVMKPLIDDIKSEL
jgi:hypothetical protein